MILKRSSSIDNTLSLLPDSLEGILSEAWHQHYEELYEPEADGSNSLQESLDQILRSFQGSYQTLNHLRYVWMSLILALVVEPTVKYYQPNNSLPEKTINRITAWLLETLVEFSNPKKQFAQVDIEKDANAMADSFHLFTKNEEIASFQVLSEALGIYSSAIKALDYEQSLEALLGILDDCLEGYAIFPGSDGRRELFDWWLLEVIPASWFLMAPKSIYSAGKLAQTKNSESYQMDKLEKISSAMWSLIYPDSQSTDRSNHHFPSSCMALDNQEYITNKVFCSDSLNQYNILSKQRVSVRPCINPFAA